MEDSVLNIESISLTNDKPKSQDSYLPSWVLKMRTKISESRNSHALAESRIEGLYKNVEILDESLVSYKIYKKRNQSSLEQLPTTAKKDLLPRFYFQDLPIEILYNIIQFLDLMSVFKISSLSKTLFVLIQNNYYWKEIMSSSFSFFLKDSNKFENTERFSVISSYLKRIKTCLRFILSMKEQRSIPKHKSIVPHRHFKTEKSITHPLPLFEHYSRSEMIMSHAETLSTDFRSVAHYSLDILERVTSNVLDPFNYLFVNEGVITVLVALLPNEEGALQNYAASIISNLFNWEAQVSKNKAFEDLRIKKFTSLFMHTSFNKTFGSSLDQFGLGFSSLLSQLQACNGNRLLISLLTSPTASINLAGGTARCSGGSKELRMIANIQGICNKQASRALVNAFYPKRSVPPEEELSVSLSTPVSSLSKASYRNNLLPPLEDSLQQLNLGPEFTLSPKHLSKPIMSDIFLLDDQPREWEFVYLFKSGSVKDKFRSLIRFFPSGEMRGKGTDLIGTFYIEGRVDPDIQGWAWYFQKSYIKVESQIFIEEALQLWLSCSEVPIETSIKSSAHVTHVGYWSSGSQAQHQDPLQ